MKQYNITGMSCAACVSRVEKAVKTVPGVDVCAVSLLTNSMGIEGSASDKDIIKAVQAAGYGASPKGAKQSQTDDLTDTQTPKLKRRLLSSLIFLVILMYFSMGHMMWGFPIPSFFEGNHIAIALLQMLLTIVVMIINGKFFISGFKALINKAPNMDTLVALGSSSAFIYSTFALFKMTTDISGKWIHEMYFESAAMILTLITVGKMLESMSKGKTTDALKSLMKLAPKTAVIVKGEEEIETPIENINIGDILVVRTGGSIPVDGVIIEGNCAIDESALTGESIPVDKTIGDKVSAATINKSGYIKLRAQRVGEDTTLSQIIKMVSDAAATKAPIAKIADKVSGIFVPVVITIAVITTLVWLFCGKDFGDALARGISVLVISCPCALGLATPVAIMVGNGVGAKHGILFKTASALESTGKVCIVALDKTGTVTKGEPKVTDVLPYSTFNEEELIKIAFSLEKKSEHPLAKAITEYAHGKESYNTEEFKTHPGNGLSAQINGHYVVGGSVKFISSMIDIDEATKAKVDELSSAGKTPLMFMLDKKLIGIIAVADIIKEECREAVEQLQNMGIKVVMLTGDNEQTAKAIGAQAGVNEVIAGVLPEGKAKVISKLKKRGLTIMVGDGVNDAPALTTADIGIAIGAGVDVAIDAADVVLMNSHVTDIPAAIRLSRKTLRNIHENLFWAFIYNIIGIPLAAGVWIPIFGLQLSPMFGAAAMSLSSFCVVSNALRLNLCKVYNPTGDKKYKFKNIQPNEEEETMTKSIKINGMMCAHCQATVKKALEALETVNEAEVNLETGIATVTLNADTDNSLLKKAVEDHDFEVVSVD